MIKKAAEDIVNIISDYQNDWGIKITTNTVLDWVNQFDKDDQLFILQEMEHIFQQTYISKAKCIELLKKYLPFLATRHKYSDVHTFLKETIFLSLQKENKSQSELLAIVNDLLKKDYGISLAECGSLRVKTMFT